MAGHRGFQLIDIGGRLERQHLVQRVELERVVMRRGARRWTGALVPDQGKRRKNALSVILALHGAVRERWLLRWLTLCELRHTRGDVVDEPVRIRRRRVRVLLHERVRLCVRGRA